MKPSAMEPCLPSEPSPVLDDLALHLATQSTALASQLQPEVRTGLADLVRSMNCYYSNLIEGHNTHPRDIDRALSEQYSSDPDKQRLQKEARAHILVQAAIDHDKGPDVSPYSVEYIRWIHKAFYETIPAVDRQVSDVAYESTIDIEPGVLRKGDVQVGAHVAPPHNALAMLLRRYEAAYTGKHLSNIRSISAIAAAHHRFVWIHPFYDGNGRVGRLMSHAGLRRLGLTDGIWSVSRGLARSADEYREKLQGADQARLGDLDGRGALSEKKLIEFCEYFLSTCIDQVSFMESLLKPAELLRRIEMYCRDESDAKRLPDKAYTLLREALLMGSFERGKAAEITGFQERKGRQILAELLEKGLLISDHHRAPVRLGFPLDVVERWFPTLYPVS